MTLFETFRAAGAKLCRVIDKNHDTLFYGAAALWCAVEALNGEGLHPELFFGLSAVKEGLRLVDYARGSRLLGEISGYTEQEKNAVVAIASVAVASCGFCFFTPTGAEGGPWADFLRGFADAGKGGASLVPYISTAIILSKLPERGVKLYEAPVRWARLLNSSATTGATPA